MFVDKHPVITLIVRQFANANPGPFKFLLGLLLLLCKNLKDLTTVLPLNFVFQQDANFLIFPWAVLEPILKIKFVGFRRPLAK
jgi:hypothetical protein